ncbi:MAG: E3 binding domain-containing protein, partial [Actinobacteria bacterium]|nr:E3 binding domain-containing protein [Actinomycetota bacterium]
RRRRVPPEGSGSQQTNRSSSEEAGQRAIFEQGYDGQAVNQGGQPASEDPDLTLDVPSLGVEELNLDVENLKARISLHAELADMVKLNVGVEADVDKVKLEAKGVDAQVLLKVGLNNVRAILSQALDALDNNPGILEDLLRTADETSGGAGQVLEGAAEPIGDTSEQGTGGGADDRGGEDEAADEPNATDAARRKAEELGINLSQVDGTGAGGRILLRDVKKAAE